MYEGYKVYRRLDKKQSRYMAMLYNGKTKHRTTMSWARYVMSCHLGRELDKNIETVDHIDGDKLNDSLDNLQLLTRADNVRKSKKTLTLIELICPVCKAYFYRRRGQTHLIKGGKHSCCSRECAYARMRNK